MNTIKSLYDKSREILKKNCNIDLDNYIIRSIQKIHLPNTNKELYENDKFVKISDNLKYDINLYFEIKENN